MTRAIALALALLVGLPAFAEPPTEEAVLEYLEVSGAQLRYEQRFEALRQSTDRAVAKLVAQGTLLPASGESLRAYVSQIIDEARTGAPWETVRPDYVRTYREQLDAREITALIALFRSPLGQLIFGKLPRVQQPLDEATSARLAPLNARIEAKLTELVRAERAPPR